MQRDLLIAILAATLAAAAPAAGAVPARAPATAAIAETAPFVPADDLGTRAVAGGGLTLDECLRMARTNHPTARQAAAAVAGARAAAGSIRAGGYPELTGALGYRRWETHSFLPAQISASVPGGISTIGPFDDWSAAFRGGWTIFDFGQRGSEVAAAEARAEAAAATGEQVARDLATAVRFAYYRLLAAREAEGVARQNLTRAENHLRLAEQRKAVGAVPQADVLRARAEIASATLALASASSAASVAAGDLNTLLGEPVERPIAIAAVPDPGAVITDSDLAAALDQAVARRPELRTALARINARARQVDAARSAFYPRLRTDGSYGVRDDEYIPADEDWAVGVSLQIPIFNGGLLEHNLEQAREELSREEAEREAQALAIRQEVWTAGARRRETRAALAAAQVLRDDTRESLRHARERYAVGAGTINDVLDAQNQLARAELVCVQSLYEQLLAETAWDRARGEG